MYRGVVTRWTAMDMSTPFVPEVVPEIEANLASGVRFGV